MPICQFTATSNRRKIDVHAHVLPRDIPDFQQKFGYPGFVTLDHREDGTTNMIKDRKLFRTVEPNCFDVQTRLRDMDTAKVNVQCISTVPVMFSYWAKPEHTEEVSRFVNDDLLAQCQHAPDRLIPLGTLPMNDVPRAIQVFDGTACGHFARPQCRHTGFPYETTITRDKLTLRRILAVHTTAGKNCRVRDVLREVTQGGSIENSAAAQGD